MVTTTRPLTDPVLEERPEPAWLPEYGDLILPTVAGAMAEADACRAQAVTMIAALEPVIGRRRAVQLDDAVNNLEHAARIEMLTRAVMAAVAGVEWDVRPNENGRGVQHLTRYLVLSYPDDPPDSEDGGTAG